MFRFIRRRDRDDEQGNGTGSSGSSGSSGSTLPLLALAGVAAFVAVLVRGTIATADKYDGMDSLVSYSSRLIAAARAMEDDEESAKARLVDDPLAKHLAGPVAMKQVKKRRTAAPKGFDRTYMVSRLAVRTRWFDDQLEECLGMPETYRSSPHRGHIVSTMDALTNEKAGSNKPLGKVRSLGSLASLGSLGSQKSVAFPSQVVELGAGLSTRPWRLHLPASLRWFDVDRQDVIDVKEDMLLKHGAECEIMSPMRRSHSKNALLEFQIGSLAGSNHNHKAVEYPLRCDSRASVSTDVGNPTWARSLLEAGFDPNKPTVWIAEGLLMYLEPERVDALLRGVAALSAPGSSLLTAVVTEQCVKRLAENRGRSKRSGSLMGEWKSGCPQDPMPWVGGLGWTPLLATTRAEIAKALDLPAEVCGFPTETDREVALPQGYFIVATVAKQS